MDKLENVVIVPMAMWRKIMDALESARYCDHPAIERLLKEIEESDDE